MTRLFTFKGDSLSINYASSAAGEIRVEIQDEYGQAIPSFTLDQCIPVFGDELDRAIEWDSDSSLTKLAGIPIRLRFSLKDADLYSFKFSSSKN